MMGGIWRTASFLAAVSVGSSVSLAQSRDGWSLSWEDTFSTTSVDTSRWEVLNRRDSFNNEKQYYTPGNVTVSDGALNLTATNVPLSGKAYRSGLVRTWAESTYGRWEIRASLPTTQGMWPAIWLLPRNVDWPLGGEIDIMENRGSQPTLVSSAYHYGSSVAAHQYKAQDFSYAVNGTPVSFHNSFHDYSVEWDQHRIRYFVDNIPSYTLYRGSAPVSASPMSLILNLAVGGDFGGDPNATTVFPQTFKVDSVRNYQRAAANANVINRSFESTAGDLFEDWVENSAGANVSAETGNARTGSKSLKLYGRFNGQANTSTLAQEIPVTAGSDVQLDGWAKNRPGDRLVGGNEGRFKIEFIDANGNVLSTKRVRTTNAQSPAAYRQYALRQTAPTGTVFARAVIEMSQVANAVGAFNVDDVSLRTTGTWVAGDLDGDGVRAAADVDLLLNSLTSDNTIFDYDASGAVNRADVSRYLLDRFATVDGDLDLDGKVNAADVSLLAAHFGELETANWSSGDLTGDGSVTKDDLLYVRLNYGFGVSGGEPLGTFGEAWAAAVPEPGSLTLMGIAFALGCTRRRR